MDRPPAHWNTPSVLIATCAMGLSLLALSTMIACQGFSSAQPASQGSQSAPLSGGLTASPTSVAFGSVQIGTSQTQTVALSNTGSSSLSLTQATVSGAGFSITGLTLPLSLAAGQTTSVSIVLTPSSAGLATGTLALTSDASTASLDVALSGTAVVAGSLSGTPTSFNFGSVQTGASQTLSETLNNGGGEDLTITQAAVTGSGFSYTGLTLPLTLTAGQSSTFGVAFAPTTAGVSNGVLALTVSGSTTTFDMALSGSGVAPLTPAALTASPSSLTFASVELGKSQTQTDTVTNTGGSSTTISQDSVAGAGFSIAGPTMPLVLAPGQSAALSVTFTPLTLNSVSGSVAVASDASDPNLTISLNGSATGAAQGQLSVSPSTINVGNVTVGQSGTQTGSISASGAGVSVSAASVPSSEFSISGLAFPVVLAAGQSASFTLTFTPQSSGAATSTASFISNASNSTASATVDGTGVAAAPYSVSLAWAASSSLNVTGYNVYRRTGTTGSFAKINGALDTATSFTDTTVADGQTYYYETTAVNSSGEESAASASVQATIPAQ